MQSADQIPIKGEIIVNAAVQHDLFPVFVRQILPIGLFAVGFSHKLCHRDLRLIPDHRRIADGPEILRRIVLHRNRGGDDIVKILQLVIHLMWIGTDLRTDLHLRLRKIRGDKGMGGLISKGMGRQGNVPIPPYPHIFLFQPNGTAQKQLLHFRLFDKDLSQLHVRSSFLLEIHLLTPPLPLPFHSLHEG